jgi:hypothetical protein
LIDEAVVLDGDVDRSAIPLAHQASARLQHDVSFQIEFAGAVELPG